MNQMMVAFKNVGFVLQSEMKPMVTRKVTVTMKDRTFPVYLPADVTRVAEFVRKKYGRTAKYQK